MFKKWEIMYQNAIYICISWYSKFVNFQWKTADIKISQVMCHIIHIIFRSSLTHILPWWNFLTKFCCQRKFLTKSLYLLLFLKKNQIWTGNPKIYFRHFKLTLTDGGYRFFFFFKKSKVFRVQQNVVLIRLHVNVALLCVVSQNKLYLWHWKMYFTLVSKFCLDYPIETKQENY